MSCTTTSSSPLSLSVGWQLFLLDLDHHFPIDLDGGLLVGGVAGFGLTTCFFRREREDRFVRTNLGLALFPLEPSVLVT